MSHCAKVRRGGVLKINMLIFLKRVSNYQLQSSHRFSATPVVFAYHQAPFGVWTTEIRHYYANILAGPTHAAFFPALILYFNSMQTRLSGMYR